MEPTESQARLLSPPDSPPQQLSKVYRRALIVLYVIECFTLVKYISLLMSALTLHREDKPWAFVLLVCSLVGVILLSYVQSDTKHHLALLVGYLFVGLLLPLFLNILGVPEILRITSELLKDRKIAQWVAECIGLVIWLYYYTLAIYVTVKCISFYYGTRRRSPPQSVDV